MYVGRIATRPGNSPLGSSTSILQIASALRPFSIVKRLLSWPRGPFALTILSLIFLLYSVLREHMQSTCIPIRVAERVSKAQTCMTHYYLLIILGCYLVSRNHYFRNIPSHLELDISYLADLCRGVEFNDVASECCLIEPVTSRKKIVVC